VPAAARALTTSTPYVVLRFVTPYMTPYDGLGLVPRSVRG
jgi:hypothetical protein